MNYCFKLIVALLTTASFVSTAAPSSSSRGLLRGYGDRLRDIIQAEDNPLELSQVLEEQLQHLGHQCPDPTLLDDLVKLDRVESFKLLFSLLQTLPNCDQVFHYMQYNDWKGFALRLAIYRRRFEIADFLLSQPDIAVPDIVEQLALSFDVAEFSADMGQLEELATRHKDKIGQLAANDHWVYLVDNAEAALLILRFIHHCRSVSPDFAALRAYKPSKMLKLLMFSNRKLKDAAIAQVIPRLAGMGASLSEEGLERLRAAHPYFYKSHEAYRDTLYEDIKEPEETHSVVEP